MAFLTGQDFGVRLIEALGLQHQNVRSITLHCVVDDAVRVTVEHYITEEQADAVADLLTNSGGQVVVREVALPEPRRRTMVGCCERNANNMACECYHPES